MDSSPVALVTGASSGIGAAVARELARRGYRVGLFARSQERLEALAAEIEKNGGKALALPGDVTRRADLEAAATRLRAHWGPIDLVLANAGIGANRDAAKPGGEVVEKAVRVNLLGVVYAIDAVVEEMAQRGRGRIAATSSVAAWRGLPGAAGYSATKAAVSAYLEGLRPALRAKGITVTTVHPGFVKTPLTKGNKFPMPFLVEADRAARIMVDGILAGRREVNFPLPLVLAMRLARQLPNPLFDLLMGRSRVTG